MRRQIQIMVLVCVAVLCGCSDRLAELGDLSMLGDCELPPEFAVVDIDDVLNTSDADACQWADGYIMFRGTVNVVNVVSETTECPWDCACCNCAAADLGFGSPDTGEAGITFINSTGKSVWCEGSNCGIFCYGMHPGKDYVVWGRFVCDPHYQNRGEDTHDRYLFMDGFCKLSTEPDPTEEFVDKCNACIDN
ncbi:MAG TPA: hypothetical protein PLY68_01365 [Myxococcota bacterium]|nr:hypothetical protein [Myxococcota bacterium]HPB51518.1 hypothetical protein [Myxococcota bacterium]HQP94825.1 hypothetical protein [Myxococcota bacterium]